MVLSLNWDRIVSFLLFVGRTTVANDRIHAAARNRHSSGLRVSEGPTGGAGLSLEDMKRRFAIALACALVPGFVQAACGSDPVTNMPDASGPTNFDASTDASQDPRCGMQAVALGVHPFAAAQDSSLGRTLSDARGWYGQV
jgi:hypothetical protein